MFRYHRQRSSGAESLTLGDEAEAFAHGRLGEHWGSREPHQQHWLWMNRLAHGSLRDVRELADASPPGGFGPVEESWTCALARLAQGVLAHVGTERELRELQRRALWPLEDDLIESPSMLATTPRMLFRLTVFALEPFLRPGSRG